MDDRFVEHRRIKTAFLRVYMPGEDLTDISVSKRDDPETDLGMIAINPKNKKDQWYVARQYYIDNFEPIKDE